MVLVVVVSFFFVAGPVLDPPPLTASALSLLLSLACRSRFQEPCHEVSGQDLAQGSRRWCCNSCLKDPLVLARRHFLVDLLSVQRSLGTCCPRQRSDNLPSESFQYQAIDPTTLLAFGSLSSNVTVFTSSSSTRSRKVFHCQTRCWVCTCFLVCQSLWHAR